MNKAIILSGIKLTEEETEILKWCEIKKVSLNAHDKELADCYFTSDYIVEWLPRDKPIYTARDKKGILVGNGETKGSSIVDCVEWLRKEDYKILLIADNTAHAKEFQDDIKRNLSNVDYVWKYTKEGNFELPYMSLKEFISL